MRRTMAHRIIFGAIVHTLWFAPTVLDAQQVANPTAAALAEFTKHATAYDEVPNFKPQVNGIYRSTPRKRRSRRAYRWRCPRCPTSSSSGWWEPAYDEHATGERHPGLHGFQGVVQGPTLSHVCAGQNGGVSRWATKEY